MPVSFRPKGKSQKIAENLLGVRKPKNKKKNGTK